MQRHRVVVLAAITAIGLAQGLGAAAQDSEEPAGITARVHGTFLDKAGGLGVLSGDMTVLRFEVRRNTVTAVGRILGTLADGQGGVLGAVDQELALPVGNVGSTCNQLRMDLAAADADVLGTEVHFDGEVAGLDSRDGTNPKALDVLCAAGELLRGTPSPEGLAHALDAVAVAVRKLRS
ncbi:MAG: hypothetical protein ABJC89_09855 [Acidobacteriota bacterium]